MITAFDIELEKTVLGTILHDASALRRIKDLLSESDFYHPFSRKVFRSILKLHGKKLVIDKDTVLNELQSTGSGVTQTEIEELLDYRDSTEKIVTICAQLSEASGKRKAIQGLESLHQMSLDETRRLDEISVGMKELLSDLSKKGAISSFKSGVELRDEYLASLLAKNADLKLTGIKTIDSRIIDLVPGEITYVAARPGTGKSAILIQAARVNAMDGKRVGYISTEIGFTKVYHRMVSALARIPGNEMLQMDKADLARMPGFVNALKTLTDLGISIDSTGPFTTTSISQKIRKLVFEQECDIVYVDHIGHISAENAKSNNDRLTEVSFTLKSLASELNIPIVGASQVNREVTKRGTTKLNISDLRDSGSLEQDASVVALMYVDNDVLTATGLSERDYLDNNDEVQIVFDVAKHRNGPVFTEKLTMERKFGVFQHKDEMYKSF